MPRSRTTLPSTALARRAAQLCLDMKATDVVLLDLRGVSDMTDYFVIASGNSDTHVRSIAQHVRDELKKEGAPVSHEEGVTQGRWALLDYVDFVVHLFHPTLRQFYQLERLWSDAETVALTDDGKPQRQQQQQQHAGRGSTDAPAGSGAPAGAAASGRERGAQQHTTEEALQ
jgi:ribosome-associated protein